MKSVSLKRTVYTIKTKKPIPPLKLALLTDFHVGEEALPAIREFLVEEKPDAILVCGDVCNDHLTDAKSISGLRFLRICARFAPTYYSLGNHEWHFNKEDKDAAKATGVRLLDDSYERLQTEDGIAEGVLIGGLTSTTKCGLIETIEHIRHTARKPNAAFAERYSERTRDDVFTILMCHHPDYYDPYLQDKDFDLIVSGHAHGGQICIGKKKDGARTKGVYAPGQGLFPKYTSGCHDGRFIISRGLTNSNGYPRFGNPTEAVLIQVSPVK